MSEYDFYNIYGYGRLDEAERARPADEQPGGDRVLVPLTDRVEDWARGHIDEGYRVEADVVEDLEAVLDLWGFGEGEDYLIK